MKKLLAVFMCITLLLVSMTSCSRSGGQTVNSNEIETRAVGGLEK